MLKNQPSASNKKLIEGFPVPWSVRFFLRRGDPHVLSAFLKISRLLDKKPQERGSSVRSAALKSADKELVKKAYAGEEIKDKELARLASLWHLIKRRKQGRLYAMMMIAMMSKEGASRKNALRLSKLLQLEKGFVDNLLYLLTKPIRKLLFQGFPYLILKTGILSFLFHHRILGKIHDWAQLQENQEKLKNNPPWKLLNALSALIHIQIGKITLFLIQHAAWKHDAIKKPDLPHYLGGHGGMTHSDEKSLVFLKKRFSVKSMMDVGCGTGGQVDMARKNGIDAYGVDGDTSLKFDKPWFFIHDFTKGHFDCKRQFDLVWSVEFLEHIEEKFQPFYMSLFQRAKIVVCTAAPPDTEESQHLEGYHHVNCRDLPYWIKTFKKYGFAFDKKSTEQLKKISSMGRSFIRERGMLFVKS